MSRKMSSLRRVPKADRGIKHRVQCFAQFSYTLVCNRYIFSSVRRKFLKFLLKIAHLLTFNI